MIRDVATMSGSSSTTRTLAPASDATRVQITRVGLKLKKPLRGGPSLSVAIHPRAAAGSATTRNGRINVYRQTSEFHQAHEHQSASAVLRAVIVVVGLVALVPKTARVVDGASERDVAVEALGDPERFAQHFAAPDGTPAPIIEVSGRTYPVEVRYRPLSEDEAL